MVILAIAGMVMIVLLVQEHTRALDRDAEIGRLMDTEGDAPLALPPVHPGMADEDLTQAIISAAKRKGLEVPKDLQERNTNHG
jgi:hypothetical protein